MSDVFGPVLHDILHGAAQGGVSIAGTVDSVALLCGQGAITSPQALLAAVQHRFQDQLSNEHVPRFWAALLDNRPQGCADDHSVEGLCTALRVRSQLAEIAFEGLHTEGGMMLLSL